MFKVVKLVLFIGFIILAVVFGMYNKAWITVDYLLGTFSAPLIVLLLSALLIGVFLGSTLFAGVLWSSRSSAKKHEKRVALLETELGKLRNPGGH